MKRFLALCFIFANAVIAGNITKTVCLDTDRLGFSTFQGYDVIELSEAISIPDPGKPALPHITATLVIPADARLINVSVEPLATGEIKGRFNILPAQVPLPISQKEKPPFVQPDPEIYSSDRPFPRENLIHYSTGSAAGFKLVSLVICPFTYYPTSGRLLFHNQFNIKLNYEADAGSPVNLSPTQKEILLQSLKGLVLNPEQLTVFAPPVLETDQPEIEYLVITSPELASSFSPYLAYKNRHGLKTELKTTDWIERNYSGRDLQEKIRNLLTDYFLHRGLVYVLLAGDNRQIPSRRIRVDVGNEQGSIPTDLYYGDLDFSWDSNHNNLFGEMDDSVDLYADVIVGRTSVENQTQVNNFITKVQTFENSPGPDYIKRSLLPSGWLWRSIGYHGRFVNDSIANITPSGWVDRKLENPPSARVVADSFDHGFLVFDPAGHGNEAGVYDEDGTPLYTTSYASRQQNQNRFSIITSLACNPGNFEAEDCLAEVALNCENGGAIAVMMNSRYGWGTPPSMGPSEKLCVRFYDYLFNLSESQLGACHNRSREEYVPLALYSSLWRWCLTEFNLLGDPTIDIWTDTPSSLSITAADTIATGSQTLTVTVRENSSPAAGVLVTAYKGGEVFAKGTTTVSGQVNLTLHPLTTGELSLTATRHNNLPAAKLLTVIQGNPEPVLVCTRQEIDDSAGANPNHILEPGETARLNLLIKNIGLAPATNTTVILHTLSPDIAIIDSVAPLGNIGAQDSASTDNLTIAAHHSATPGSSPEFLAILHSDQNQSESFFTITLGYPGRIWADIDTGACALSITARGTIGYDQVESRQGRGFRYPKTDTSGLNIASFVIGNSSEYLVDRFYNQDGCDADWQLQDSIRNRLPLYNAAQLLHSSFNDRAHPQPKNIIVEQLALGLNQPELSNTVVLVYDIINTGTGSLDRLFSGILADFDVIPTDRLHDLAYTIADLNTAFMRNVNSSRRYLGVKLLFSASQANLTCIDHSRYVYPDSGMTDDMKYRALTGTLGTQRSDRALNWSVGVSTGPFDLAPNGRQRLAFAFIAAPDSESYINSCETVQQWFDNNVGIEEYHHTAKPDFSPLLVEPNCFTHKTTIRYQLPATSSVLITAYDITGRTVATLLEQNQPAGVHTLLWQPKQLPQGIYFIKLETPSFTSAQRALLLR